MYDLRSPYTHRGETGQDLRAGQAKLAHAQPNATYGDTYYGMPAIKSPYYGWLVATYFFIGGLASALPFIAGVVDVLGRKRDRGVVRAGRYISLLGAIASPILLIADLHHPRRWYNMLRIFRGTSPMSIGSWALVSFGMSTGAVAFGQALQDLFGWRIGRGIARLFTLPAGLTGGIVSLYTGTLLAATNVPLWASGFPFLSSLFTSSAASTATATLILAADATRASRDTRRRLGGLALVTSAAELLFATGVMAHWRKTRADAALERSGLSNMWNWGVLGMGISLPLIAHIIELITGGRSKSLSRVAALAALAGGFLVRVVFIFGGKESARRPEDYFRMTQSH